MHVQCTLTANRFKNRSKSKSNTINKSIRIDRTCIALNNESAYCDCWCTINSFWRKVHASVRKFFSNIFDLFWFMRFFYSKRLTTEAAVSAKRRFLRVAFILMDRRSDCETNRKFINIRLKHRLTANVTLNGFLKTTLNTFSKYTPITLI